MVGFDGTEPVMLDTVGRQVRQDIKVNVGSDLGPSIYVEDQALTTSQLGGSTFYQAKLKQILWADTANVVTHVVLFAQDPNDPTTYDESRAIGFADGFRDFRLVDTSVLLTESIAVGERIFVVFYADTMANGSFDGGGVDQPALINGSPMIGSFEVLAP